MWKIVIAGTTALAIAGTSLVYAQQRPGAPGAAGAPEASESVQRWRPSAEDISAYSDARIASLRAGLKLTAEQEKLWPAVEAALRDVSKQRSERFTARASADRPADPIERLAVRADAMTQNGTAMKKLADAAGPLYKSLDDSQKRRFLVLANLEGRKHHGRHAGMHGYRGGKGPAQMGPEGGPRPQ